MRTRNGTSLRSPDYFSSIVFFSRSVDSVAEADPTPAGGVKNSYGSFRKGLFSLEVSPE